MQPRVWISCIATVYYTTLVLSWMMMMMNQTVVYGTFFFFLFFFFIWLAEFASEVWPLCHEAFCMWHTVTILWLKELVKLNILDTLVKVKCTSCH